MSKNLKSKLSTGSVVLCRNGAKYLVVNDRILLNIFSKGSTSHLSLSEYLLDLHHDRDEAYDIMAFTQCGSVSYKYRRGLSGLWDWERSKSSPCILDEVERKYLSAVIKPFRAYVNNISLISDKTNTYYMCIQLEDDNATLPRFIAGTMYTGMEPYKEYTLEELGL